MFENKIFVTTVSEESNTGVFDIGPLTAGFGHTIGNSLRRILLSSLEGAAADNVQADGVEHEFSTIENVKEDMVEIILNLKQLRFSLLKDEAVLTLEKKGKGPVTAADFLKDAECVPMMPEQPICTITAPSGSVSMRVTVKKGRGYQTVEMKSDRSKVVGVITLDSTFSPVLKASYEVEHTRVGQETNLDKIVLTIETDGSITPKDALQEGCQILVTHFSEIGTLPEPEEIVEEAAPELAPEEKPVVTPKTKIEDAGLSSRTTNALLTGGYKTVSGLLRLSEIKLEGIKGLGAKGLDEVKDMLTRVEEE